MPGVCEGGRGMKRWVGHGVESGDPGIRQWDQSWGTSRLPLLCGAHDNLAAPKGTVCRLEVLSGKGRGGMPWGGGGLRGRGREAHLGGRCGRVILLLQTDCGGGVLPPRPRRGLGRGLASELGFLASRICL